MNFPSKTLLNKRERRSRRPLPKLQLPMIENGNRRSYCLVMSLTEIEEAVDKLSPEELAKLAAHIARRDKVAWDQEIEQDFSPGGKHVKVLKKVDAEIEAGNFTPLL
jgi:hypothetical protein